MGYLTLNEYGVVGNRTSAALISRMGSVDWCSLPFLDSPSHFGALWHETQGGKFQISPKGEFQSEQHYLPKTLVLETSFETSSGRGILTDWMPVGNVGTRDPAALRRQIRVTEGRIHWVLQCTPRFSYGSAAGHAERFRSGILFRGHLSEEIGCIAGSPHSPALSPNGTSAQCEFMLEQGQSADFIWSWGREGMAHLAHSAEIVKSSLEDTARFWREHAHSCSASCPLSGPWHDAVARSGTILKLLSNDFSGSIAEAVTASPTENIFLGDRRQTWIRDGASAMSAFANLGRLEEARSYFAWLSDIIIRDGAQGLQAAYNLDGSKLLSDTESHSLGTFPGTVRSLREGAHPRRQFQLEIYGQVMLSAVEQYRLFGELPDGLWPRLEEIADYVCQVWRRPDFGSWTVSEARSRPEHYTTSKLYCWIALDRASWLREALGLAISQKWKEEIAKLHRTICEQGFDTRRGSFVRTFGSQELDANCLMLPLTGFLPFEDPRIKSTLNVIESELSSGIFIYRYASREGFATHSGPNLASSLLFAACLAHSGRVEEASDRLAELCTYTTKLGLLGDQVHPSSGENTGHFPSATTHLALITAALHVIDARKRTLSFPPWITLPEVEAQQIAS